MENLRQSRIQSFAYVVVVLAALCVSCLYSAAMPGFHRSAAGVRLESMINPNNAPVGSLVRLPGIGLTKAQAIVSYRESIKITDSQPFCSFDDLQKVQGIGPKTAEGVAEFVKFE
jgi:competence ComEA-like helix-hairpin-helix protein